MKYKEEQLAKVLGKTSAKELLKLTANYDKYILKFKNSINKLLEPAGYEVKLGIAFVKKEPTKQ